MSSANEDLSGYIRTRVSEEGHRREVIYMDGGYRDLVLFGLLIDDFECVEADRFYDQLKLTLTTRRLWMKIFIERMI